MGERVPGSWEGRAMGADGLNTVVVNQKDGAPEGAVFIGRPSPFGGPFVIGKSDTRAEVVEKYRA